MNTSRLTWVLTFLMLLLVESTPTGPWCSPTRFFFSFYFSSLSNRLHFFFKQRFWNSSMILLAPDCVLENPKTNCGLWKSVTQVKLISLATRLMACSSGFFFLSQKYLHHS